MKLLRILSLAVLALASGAWGDCGNGLTNQEPLFQCNWGCPATGRSGSTTYRAGNKAGAENTCRTDPGLVCEDTSCTCSLAD